MSRSEVFKKPIIWIGFFLLNALILAAGVSAVALAPQPGTHATTCAPVGPSDPDGDGLSTDQENAINTKQGGLRTYYLAKPGKPDPLHTLATNDCDSDDDGKSDGAEDFDGDGLTNAADVKAGFDAYNWNSHDNDTTSDTDEDADEDFLTTKQELGLGLDPQDPDSNNNGTTDDREKNLDSDSLDNWEEFQAGHDPRDHDSNSTKTPVNEGSNGTNDNLENLELPNKDGLNNEQEFNPPPALRDPSRPNMVFDPLKPDTDGDTTPDHLDTGGGFEGRRAKY